MIKGTDALLLFAALPAEQVTISDMVFRDNLLDRPCHASGDSLDRYIVPKIRVPRDFQYPPGRSSTESSVIGLEDCHVTAIGKTMTLTFKRTEEVAPPGHLEVAGMNVGRLSITLLDTDDSSLLKPGASHNKGQGEKVTGNSPEPPFGAYVVATPEALRTKNVILGDYEVTATSELTYRQQDLCIGYFR